MKNAVPAAATNSSGLAGRPAEPGSAVPPQRRGTESGLPLAGLPPEAARSVRAAYGRELARRLPALEAALAVLCAGDQVADIEGRIRDAHALASSSVVVGEATAAHAFRDVERLLAGDGAERATDIGYAAARDRLETATRSLDRWRSDGVPA